MSIQSEINRIAGAKSDIADAIEDMGGTLSPGASIEDMAAGVRSIPQGTSDYTDLTNKPQINGNTLTGNKTGTDLGLVNAVTGKQLSTEDYTTAEKTKLAGIEAQANKTVIDDTLTNTGEAADAKAVGDEISDVRNTLNSEIATRQTYVRPNLLDNWYFVGGGSQLGDGVFPINQRGQTSYSANGYAIDRWNKASNASLELGANGVKYTRTGASAYPTLAQKITGVKAGMTITLSALVRSHFEAAGNIIYIRLMAGNNSVFGFSIDQSYSDFELITGQLTCTEDITEVRFQFSNPSETSNVGDWVEISAVKLELGSGQTLAHNEGTDANPVWVLNEIPDYGEQLLKCQRYLQVLGASIRLRSAARFINGGGNTILDFYYRLYPEMYNIPSFSNASWNMTIYGGGSNVASQYSYSKANTTKAILNIRAQKNSDDGLTDAQLFSGTNVYISCEP